jgi:hypothetical protein
VFVCKSYYFECIINELGINSNTSSNTTYKPTSYDKDEILANQRSFMTSLSIPSGKESEDLPYLYWIPKVHKTPYKEMYIAGSSTCSTKELSIHLTKILSAVKEGEKKYCELFIEEGHNSYPLVCRRPAETVSLQRRQICYR